MKNHKKILIALFIVMFPVFGCAQYEKNKIDQENRIISNDAAVESEAHNFIEIEFNPGSSRLSENSKSSLNKIMKQAKNAGKIDEVLLFSWADEDYPSKNMIQLSPSQRSLASQRNKSIEHFINSIKKVDVNSYNMAERPSSISQWFNTSDNRLKQAFLNAGLPTTADSTNYTSKASHSVIFITLE